MNRFKVFYKLSVIAIVIFLAFCSHTYNSERRIKKEAGELQYVYNEALSAFKTGNIYAVIEGLESALQELNKDLISVPGYMAIIQNYRDMLKEIKSNFYIKTDGAWGFIDNIYQLAQSDEQEILTPNFSLFYSDEISVEPLQINDFFYTYKYISGIENSVDYSGIPDSTGVVNSISLNKTGKFEEALIELQIYIQINQSEKYLITDKPIMFKYPSPSFTLVIKDGERVKDLSERLQSTGIILENSILEIASSYNFSKYSFVPDPADSLSRFEGLFTPGYYLFHYKDVLPLDYADNKEEQAETNTDVIINILLEESSIRFENMQKVNGFGVYSQIILASIVEKEAASNRNYEEIASVFYNRLNDGTSLGSCPTVEYVLGYHRPFLTIDDVSINSAYNVYKYPGLPPTPISFFSNEALKAVMEPINTDLFFFVFDWTTGELLFAVTYEGHKENANIAYQNYINEYGRNSLHDIYYDKFYGE